MPQFRIQRGKCLIHQQSFRLCKQGAHQGGARRLPAGQGGWIAAFKSGKASQFQGIGHARLAVMAMVGGKGNCQIVANRHMRKQQRVLKHQPDAPVLCIKAANHPPVQQHITRGMHIPVRCSADDGQQCRFPAATCTLDQAQTAGFDINAQTADQRHLIGDGYRYVAKT